MKLGFHYTSAALLAIVGAVIAVAVSFGLHLTQDNINSVLQLAGLILGGIAVGGGWKSRSLLRAGVNRDRLKVAGIDLHFTPAIIVSAIGAVIAVAVSFGFHMTQENIDSVMKLVGLIFGGIVVGGGIKSSGLIESGQSTLAPGLPARGGVGSTRGPDV